MKEKEKEELLRLLMELRGDLEEKLKKTIKPEFEIQMKSNEEGTGCSIKVSGNKPSICFALSQLTTDLLKETTITAEDVRKAIEIGIEAYEDDNEEE